MNLQEINVKFDLLNAEFDAVAALAEQYRRIQMTPIVDDDYPEVRHKYEGAVRGFLKAAQANGRAALTDAIVSRPAKQSIIQPWATELGLRHQGVLVSAIRGCDSVEREDPSKWLVRCFRGVLLRAHCGDLKKAASFMVPFDQEIWDHTTADFYRSIDHYPNHWLLHFMHAAEIVGYKHPDVRISKAFGELYLRLVKKFHLNPELESQMDRRLSVDEQTFKAEQA